MQQRKKEKFLDKGNQYLEQELDLMNLIKAQRIQFAQLKCLLTPAQFKVSQTAFAEHIIDSSDETNSDNNDQDESGHSAFGP